MRVREILKELHLDALVITDPYNMRYISSFRGGEGILYISEEQKVLITDSRYTEQAEQESDFTVVEENSGHKRTVILKECMEKENKAEGFRMGYEDESLLCADFDKLRESLPVEGWVPMGGRVDALRRLKSEEELAWLERAEEIGDRAFEKILKILKPGMTELEVAAELEYLMKKEGAEDLSFNSIVASGLNSSMPHAIPGEKKLEEGDFITMDFGCKYKGYCSDMTRTVVLGKASEKQKEIYETVLKAQLAALDALKAGVTGQSVDKAARDIITEAGYGDCFGHGLGHSVGLFIHENPRLSPNDDTVLQPGMIETVEPGIYVPGFGGVRIEDMVVVTEDGYRNFTHSPKELIEIPV
ncbi:MAG: aminopeptidase P family protein [Clostridiales bacterium]|nr:aminopeptidase P family protein [Clostridiales bacterium]